jgi:hypothetical protein
VAEVTTHGDLGPELRKLAQAVLDGIDPAVRAAAGRALAGGAARCQQVWCPVCALAALVTGEQHPLLNVIADHSVSLLSMVRALIDELEKPGDKSGDDSDEPPPGGDDPMAPADNGAGKSRYQPIPITVDD